MGAVFETRPAGGGGALGLALRSVSKGVVEVSLGSPTSDPRPRGFSLFDAWSLASGCSTSGVDAIVHFRSVGRL